MCILYYIILYIFLNLRREKNIETEIPKMMSCSLAWLYITFYALKFQNSQDVHSNHTLSADLSNI